MSEFDLDTRGGYLATSFCNSTMSLHDPTCNVQFEDQNVPSPQDLITDYSCPTALIQQYLQIACETNESQINLIPQSCRPPLLNFHG